MFSRITLASLLSCFILLILSPGALAGLKGQTRQDQKVEAARPDPRAAFGVVDLVAASMDDGLYLEDCAASPYHPTHGGQGQGQDHGLGDGRGRLGFTHGDFGHGTHCSGN
jgi:hypothetical protein